MNINIHHQQRCHGNALFLPAVCRPLGIVALVPGLLFLLLSGFVGWQEYQKEAHWLKAIAIVTELVPQLDRSSSSGSRMPEGRRVSDMASVGEGTFVSVKSEATPRYLYTPRFLFTAQDGKEYEVSSALASSPPAYRVGEQVTIHYPVENPQAAAPHSFWQQYFSTVILAGIGCGMAGLGAILVLISRFSAPPQPNIEKKELDLPDGVDVW